MTLCFLRKAVTEVLVSLGLQGYMRLLGTVIKSRNFLHKTGNISRSQWRMLKYLLFYFIY